MKNKRSGNEKEERLEEGEAEKTEKYRKRENVKKENSFLRKQVTIECNNNKKKKGK